MRELESEEEREREREKRRKPSPLDRCHALVVNDETALSDSHSVQIQMSDRAKGVTTAAAWTSMEVSRCGGHRTTAPPLFSRHAQDQVDSRHR